MLFKLADENVLFWYFHLVPLKPCIFSYYHLVFWLQPLNEPKRFLYLTYDAIFCCLVQKLFSPAFNGSTFFTAWATELAYSCSCAECSVNKCQALPDTNCGLCCTVKLWWLARIWNIPMYFKWFNCNNGFFLKLNFKSALPFQSQDLTVFFPSSLLYVLPDWIFNLCNSLILWLRSPDSLLSNSGHYIQSVQFYWFH